MFDWIGDAIDWIGDGISSLWDSTIGSATEAIGDWIWECMFEWLFNLIFGAVSELFELVNHKNRRLLFFYNALIKQGRFFYHSVFYQ